MKLVRKEFREYDNYNVGILLDNDTFFIYSEDEKSVTVKSTKDKTLGGFEKTLAKVLPHLLKYVSIKVASEIIITISEIVESREIGNHWQSFNIRLVSNSETNWEDELHGWW